MNIPSRLDSIVYTEVHECIQNGTFEEYIKEHGEAIVQDGVRLVAIWVENDGQPNEKVVDISVDIRNNEVFFVERVNMDDDTRSFYKEFKYALQEMEHDILHFEELDIPKKCSSIF